MEQRTYTFVKNVRGSLGFNLDSYNMQLPTRHFEIPYNVKQIIVPFPYAVGLFISTDALNDFNAGLFTINDFESLKATAIELGFYPDEAPAEVISVEELEKAVAEGDTIFVKRALDTKKPSLTDAVLGFAHDHADSLSVAMVKLIQNTCGVMLGSNE